MTLNFVKIYGFLWKYFDTVRTFSYFQLKVPAFYVMIKLVRTPDAFRNFISDLTIKEDIMKHILENERFQITVSDHGAELTGIYDKEKQHQILWQADPAFWPRH